MVRKAGLRRKGRSNIRDAIKTLPSRLANAVAMKSAPGLTSAARKDYQRGRNAYGDKRPLGVRGNALTLNESGDTFRTVRFRRSGTIVEAVLGTQYARFLIGKYKILPASREAVPANWKRLLDRIVAEVKAAGGP